MQCSQQQSSVQGGTQPSLASHMVARRTVVYQWLCSHCSKTVGQSGQATPAEGSTGVAAEALLLRGVADCGLGSTKQRNAGRNAGRLTSDLQCQQCASLGSEWPRETELNARLGGRLVDDFLRSLVVHLLRMTHTAEYFGKYCLHYWQRPWPKWPHGQARRLASLQAWHTSLQSIQISTAAAPQHVVLSPATTAAM